MASITPIRILCFGASITAGWSQLGTRYYPYASTLEAHLKEALPNEHFSIQVDGLPGDTVIQGKYTKRLRSLISTATSPYDWVIIQGGGNDLLRLCRDPKKILEALREVWGIAFDAGSKVIALTVTKTVNQTEESARRYDALNELIVSEEHEKLYSVDVSKMLPPATVNNVISKIYERDGLHFGKKGYEMMGDAIASSLVEMIRAEATGKHTGDVPNHSHKHHFNASNSGSRCTRSKL